MSTTEYKYIYYTIVTENYNKDKIKTKNIKGNYIILNNDLSTLTEKDDDIKLYRSIVVDPDTNDILCFSPPNSIGITPFITKYPDHCEFIYVNEIIEGTMINLFYDKRHEKWEIATRGSIGGNTWFYRNHYNEDESDNIQKTFRQMFLDAISGSNEEAELNINPYISQLSKDYCYSFVLQHPDNHIVQDIFEPAVYVIAVYELNEKTVKVIPPTIYEEWDWLKPIKSNGWDSPIINVYYPKRYLTRSYNDFLSISTGILPDKFNMGIMITHLLTNERSSIPNMSYEDVKQIRGNNPNLQYQYFALSELDQKQTFLYHFPRYIRLFNQFNIQYQEFITIVHQAYFSYYVKKEGIEIAKRFFIHASRIHHQYYLPALNNGEKIIITRPVVKEYFDNMKPNEILYFLYYDKRQIVLENKRKKWNEAADETEVTEAMEATEAAVTEMDV